jgi:uncharacterized protein YjbI with pentapeptide repeats
MKTEKLLPILKQDSDTWNQWRTNNPNARIDLRYINEPNINLRNYNLSNAKFNDSIIPASNFTYAELENTIFENSKLSNSYFTGANIKRANFNSADLKKAHFDGVKANWVTLKETHLVRAKFRGSDFSHSEFLKCDLRKANFENAILYHTNFYPSNLRGANFKNADLRGASLMLTNLTGANFQGANLEGVNLQGAQLIDANFEGANISNSSVYGASVWEVNLKGCKQENLVVTQQSQLNGFFKKMPIITVDDVQIAQFIYLMIHNPNIRNVIDTITSKVVLILGRFTKDRLKVLEELRVSLREHNYIPVLFDFENAENRDITETVSTLAHLSRFVIADLTDPKSIPHELSHVIPNLPSVPVIPIILDGQREYSMFEHFERYPWVLKIYKYQDEKTLISNIEKEIIIPSETKAIEMKNNRK